MITDVGLLVTELKEIGDKLNGICNSGEPGSIKATELLEENRETLVDVNIYLQLAQLKKMADRYKTLSEFFVKGYATIKRDLYSSNSDIIAGIDNYRKKLTQLPEGKSEPESTKIEVKEKIAVNERRLEYNDKILDTYYKILSKSFDKKV